MQGTTLGPLIRAFGLTGPAELERRRESEDRAWQLMAEAQQRAIVDLSLQPDGSQRHPRLVEQYTLRANLAAEFQDDRDKHGPIKQEHNVAVLRAIAAGRDAILALHASGEIHDRVLRSLEQELDFQQLVAESHAG